MMDTILKGSFNPKILTILLGVIIFIGVLFILDKLLMPRLKLHSRMAIYGLAFVSLPLAYFIAVMIIPMIDAFIFSFQKYNILSPIKPFVGLQNYQYILGNELFWTALGNAFKFTIFRVPLVLILGLFTAMMFQLINKGKNFLAF